MSRTNLIKDNITRESIKELENTFEAIKRITPLSKVPDETSYSIDGIEYNKLVDAINKITASYKRR
jgi:cobalamin biosynthesis Co2+ chelatase CbiK